MTPLGHSIARRILLQGPISIAEFMAEALGHPQHGYYMNRDRFGRDGDFITAPEISQMFGELTGLWCAEMWRLMGQPDPVLLVELGPGRGTLLADAMRATRVLPGFREAVSIHLVETSPALRRAQRASLAGLAARWHDAVDDVPEGPLIVIANEFLDALPIHQFERRDAGWCERRVTVEGDDFQIVLGPATATAAALLPKSLRDSASVGDVVEVAPAAVSLMGMIAERIARHGGAALIIDYGHADHAVGDTLQAVRRHAPHAVLADPGDADLTAHVDFAAVAAAARPHAAVYGPVPQGVLLQRLGIALRTQQLRQRANATQRAAIDSGVHRLIDPAEMGTLFKALAICHKDLPVPPGFDDTHETR